MHSKRWGLNILLIIAFVAVISGILSQYHWRFPYGQELLSERFSTTQTIKQLSIITNQVAKRTAQLAIFRLPNETKLIFDYQAADSLQNEGGAPVTNATLIPGLRGTRSIITLSQQVGISGGLVPQGIAYSPKYIFISAYDGAYKVNSVIYVINRQTMRYEKTLVLHGQPHTGGIAYDADHQRLWVCGYSHREATLFIINLATIEHYQFKSQHQPIQYASLTYLPQLKRSSQVTYYQHRLYVGYFSKGDRGRLQAYKLNANGFLAGRQSQTSKQFGKVSIAASPALNQTCPTQIQGMTIVDGMILMSQSYGHQSSKLYVFKLSRRANAYTKSQALKIIKMPPMMEQIGNEDGQLYAVFESGGRRYRDKYGVGVDRILTFDLTTLLNNEVTR